MNENKFQATLIHDIQARLPGALVIKNDPAHMQGICDLTVFYNNNWAMLEVKKSKDAAKRPNQDYYVEEFNRMSFAAFIYPENKEEVLNALEQSLRA